MTENEDSERAMQQSKPPLEAWFVVEVDVDREHDCPLFTSIDGPFPSEKRQNASETGQRKRGNRRKRSGTAMFRTISKDGTSSRSTSEISKSTSLNAKTRSRTRS